MSTAPQSTLSEEVRQAVRETLGEVLDGMSGKVYSPRIKLLTIEQVCEVTGLAQSTIYQLVESEDFPKPVKIGRKNFWRESSLIAYLDKKEGKSA